MLSALGLLISGLLILVWSADRFVDGSASVAKHFQLPPLLIGMVIVGFGTSVPEMLVSALSAIQGNPGIALGNAYGSNITNIALILGITALVKPIKVESGVLRSQLPILTLVTLLAAWQIRDGQLTRLDAVVLLVFFGILMVWTVFQGLRQKKDTLAQEMKKNLEGSVMSLSRGIFWVFAGLLLLLISSRMLVSGAIQIARHFGMSDLIIGLTIVALGTSLPELASSVMAARKGEHDIALGNILGSNLFNTLVVVGIAGGIHPLLVERQVFVRDMPVMLGLTLSLFIIGFGFKGPGRINRLEGSALLISYIIYTTVLLSGQS